MNGINLADGETMTDAGMQVDSQQAERGEIKSFKAIVVSYEDFDGNTWRNPLYDNWVSSIVSRRCDNQNGDRTLFRRKM